MSQCIHFFGDLGLNGGQFVQQLARVLVLDGGLAHGPIVPTHVYFALIPSENIVLQKGANAADTAWLGLEGLGRKQNLAFDHGEILAAAITRLRNKVEYTSLPAYLLPAEFTLSELQRMYEIVMERPIEKSAFRTRVLSSGLVTPAGDKMREGPNRPAQLYRLTDPANPVVFPRTFNPRRT